MTQTPLRCSTARIAGLGPPADLNITVVSTPRSLHPALLRSSRPIRFALLPRRTVALDELYSETRLQRHRLPDLAFDMTAPPTSRTYPPGTYLCELNSENELERHAVALICTRAFVSHPTYLWFAGVRRPGELPCHSRTTD